MRKFNKADVLQYSLVVCWSLMAPTVEVYLGQHCVSLMHNCIIVNGYYFCVMIILCPNTIRKLQLHFFIYFFLPSFSILLLDYYHSDSAFILSCGASIICIMYYLKRVVELGESLGIWFICDSSLLDAKISL